MFSLMPANSFRHHTVKPVAPSFMSYHIILIKYVAFGHIIRSLAFRH